MKISERFKKEYPDVSDCKILYRGDGIVLIEVTKDNVSLKSALTTDEMKTFYALMRIAESSANDYLYVKIVNVVKQIDALSEQKKGKKEIEDEQ